MREKSLDCLANLRLIKKVLIVQSWDFHTSQLSKNVLMQNKQKLKPVIFSSDLFLKLVLIKKFVVMNSWTLLSSFVASFATIGGPYKVRTNKMRGFVQSVILNWL